MTKAWKQLVERLEELSDLNAAASLMHWDQSVIMPPKGGPSRARASATLESLIHAGLTDPKVGELLDELGGDDSLDEVQRASVRVLRRHYDKATKVPEDLVRALAETTNLAYQTWTEAKPASDFALFQPHLEKIIELRKQQADAIGYANERYDALLDDFEPGMTAAEVESMFEELSSELVPVVETVIAAADDKPAFLVGDYEPRVQLEFSQWLIEQLNFDTTAGRLDTSPHPFTMGVAKGDTRQTTRTRREDLLSSIYATMHETGHGLYDQGLPAQWSDLPIGQPASLGMHESQSRMWENHVGRSRAFTTFLLPELKRRFESELGGVTPEEFYQGANHPERTLIRVEADELTYNLHIILRFELELAMFRDELEVADLPDAWDQKMEKHLGIRPEKHADGVLQDMHWSGGMQGYFPTYSLGTLYAAAFFEKAEEQLGSLQDDFKNGDGSKLLEWLRTNIHSKGYSKDAKDIAFDVLGEPLSATPFINYLKKKYGELYEVTF